MGLQSQVIFAVIALSSVAILGKAAVLKAEDVACQTGEACAGINLIVTVENTSYCCQDNRTTPHTTLHPNVSCTCSVDPYAGLSNEEQIQLWATLNMDKGRFCQYGDDACRGYHTDSLTVNNVTLVFCCKKPSDISRYVFSDVAAYNSTGCLCTETPPPARSAPAYTMPAAGEQYNSSGEQCYFNQDCDDFPIQKCAGPSASFCCYRSRGIVTHNINSNTTGCTCTQEFLGNECEPNTHPLPELATTAECLTSCGDVAEDDKCVGENKEQRCCPSSMDLMAEIVDGTFTSCSCSWPASGNTTCARRQTSAAPRVTLTWMTLLAAGVFAIYIK